MPDKNCTPEIVRIKEHRVLGPDGPVARGYLGKYAWLVKLFGKNLNTLLGGPTTEWDPMVIRGGKAVGSYPNAILNHRGCGLKVKLWIRELRLSVPIIRSLGDAARVASEGKIDS